MSVSIREPQVLLFNSTHRKGRTSVHETYVTMQQDSKVTFNCNQSSILKLHKRRDWSAILYNHHFVQWVTGYYVDNINLHLSNLALYICGRLFIKRIRKSWTRMQNMMRKTVTTNVFPRLRITCHTLCSYTYRTHVTLLLVPDSDLL